MNEDVPLRCSCGSLRGRVRDVSPRVGSRVVCYCDDCQSFAHFLGGADRILDANGGTEIFQTSPARVELTDGVGHLACVRLRPSGLLRWYADCCRTPIGNTLPMRQLPFVGLVHRCMAPDSAGGSREERLGPIRFRAFARFAKGDRSALHAHDKAPPLLVLGIARRVVAARLRGDHARSPFFGAETGEPRVVPHVLTEEELHAVETARDAA